MSKQARKIEESVTNNVTNKKAKSSHADEYSDDDWLEDLKTCTTGARCRPRCA